jgi:hypothetical protein
MTSLLLRYHWRRLTLAPRCGARKRFHPADAAIALAIGYFLSSGSSVLTITVGTILKLLYTDLTNLMA